MSRHLDSSGEWFDAPRWDDDRRAFPDADEDGLWFAVTGESPLELVRDVELGIRAGERLDVMESESDVKWFAEQAQLEAAVR